MDLISREKAIVQLSHNKTGNDDSDVVIQHDIATVQGVPSAFEGMTNEEVMKAVFGKSYADIDSYIYGSKDVEVKQWCRSPYKRVSE